MILATCSNLNIVEYKSNNTDGNNNNTNVVI